jgi:gluconate 2-dehydrogenase subunit 3-like protein
MRRTGTTPGDSGRFPGFDTMREARHWDEATRDVVRQRVEHPPSVRFFDEHQWITVQALCDRLLAQDDDPRVPIAAFIDARLHARDGDGYRHVDMPDDGEAWRRSLAGLDEDAHAEHGAPFASLELHRQRRLVECVRITEGAWHGMPAARTFELWMRYATTAFYSHPWAWNEIGFPGPAYPRGYKTLGLGQLEPFERSEKDPRDPIPWAQKVDAAKRAHAERPDDEGEPP